MMGFNPVYIDGFGINLGKCSNKVYWPEFYIDNFYPLNENHKHPIYHNKNMLRQHNIINDAPFALESDIYDHYSLMINHTNIIRYTPMFMKNIIYHYEDATEYLSSKWMKNWDELLQIVNHLDPINKPDLNPYWLTLDVWLPNETNS